MNKYLSAMFVIFFLTSCGENDISNQPPSFGYHVDKIVRVNEGSLDIGTFQATDPDGDWYISDWSIIYRIHSV